MLFGSASPLLLGLMSLRAGLAARVLPDNFSRAHGNDVKPDLALISALVVVCILPFTPLSPNCLSLVISYPRSWPGHETIICGPVVRSTDTPVGLGNASLCARRGLDESERGGRWEWRQPCVTWLGTACRHCLVSCTQKQP